MGFKHFVFFWCCRIWPWIRSHHQCSASRGPSGSKWQYWLIRKSCSSLWWHFFIWGWGKQQGTNQRWTWWKRTGWRWEKQSLIHQFVLQHTSRAEGTAHSWRTNKKTWLIFTYKIWMPWSIFASEYALKDHGPILFLFVFTCVVDKDPNSPSWSSMATWGGIMKSGWHSYTFTM